VDRDVWNLLLTRLILLDFCPDSIFREQHFLFAVETTISAWFLGKAKFGGLTCLWQWIEHSRVLFKLNFSIKQNQNLGDFIRGAAVSINSKELWESSHHYMVQCSSGMGWFRWIGAMKWLFYYFYIKQFRLLFWQLRRISHKLTSLVGSVNSQHVQRQKYMEPNAGAWFHKLMSLQR